MSILDDIARNVEVLSLEAKKAYDAKKLERRIKSYRKEETELYTRLGKLLYQSRGELLDEGECEVMFDNLDAIKARMKHLDRQISDIRGRTEADEEKYQRLSRKESDLTITRTDGGIQLIRLCPDCQTANSPDDGSCTECGHVFE